jgi:uncharacterized membrane protein
MALLLTGIALWWAAHFFKRIAPGPRDQMGMAGKGAMAVLIIAGVVLMVIGYRSAEFINVWFPPGWLTHLNNLLMLLALWVYGSSAAKGAKAWPAYKTRHPQLIGFKIWAIAHLLVNGDLASILLFGSLLAWAVVEVIVINRATPDWTQPEPAGAKTYVRLAVITLVLYTVIAGIHAGLGVNPFG